MHQIDPATIDLSSFIDSSLSPWHVVRNIIKIAQKEDFSILHEKEDWVIKPESSYLIQRGCSLILIRTPKVSLESISMVAAHTDSPALKIKPNPVTQKEGHTLLQLEAYGAPILSSWIGRDLSVAGLVIKQDELASAKECCDSLIEIPSALFIPHVALHLDRTVNDLGHQVAKHDHLFAFITNNEVKRSYDDSSVVYRELYAVSEEGVSERDGYVSGPRLDNLACLIPALQAFMNQPHSDRKLKVFVAWNHEEIGSQTAEGALSPFLSDILERLSIGFGLARSSYLKLKSKSEMISCDVAHGYHPNYPEKYDLKHSPKLGSGVVVKTNPNMRYCQSASLSAKFTSLVKTNSIPHTFYSLRNDLQSGSTIGPLVSSQMGVETIDIGIPLIGMHSIREFVDRNDIKALQKALDAFYRAP